MNKRTTILACLFFVSFVMVFGFVLWLQMPDGNQAHAADAVETEEVTAVYRDILSAEYEISLQESSPGSSVYQAPNRENQIRTYFNEQGITVVPRMPNNLDWTWGLQLVAAGDLDIAAEGDLPVLSVAQNRATYERGAVSEWYINDVNGLEQGFTVSEPVADEAILALDLAISGDLIPVMVADNTAIDFAAVGGAHVLRYSDLYAFDANGRNLPAHMSLVNLDEQRQAVRLSVDTVAAAYPITIDPVASTAPWQAFIAQSADFGFDVSDAGDVNGDGYDDVLVGANWFDNGQNDEGAAFLYYGSADGLSQTFDWRGESNNALAEMGYAVSTAGDVNNDGYDDLIIGAPGYQGRGGAFLYLGAAGGPATTPAVVLPGQQNGSKFGFAVSAAGYVNNDNFADVIVGAPEYDGNWGADEGRAYVYYGRSAGLPTASNWISEIDDQFGGPGALFGHSVDTAGDFDNNGFDDVVIGAPYYAPDGQSGLMAVFPGSSSGLPNSGGIATLVDGYSDTADFNVLSELGFAVAGAGDVNGDNIDDVIVGAPKYDFDSQVTGAEGAAYLYLGNTNRFSGSTGGYDTRILPLQLDSLFGYDVDGAGDINLDGFDDLIIGAPQYDDARTNGGAALLYLGNPDFFWSGFDIGYFGEQANSVYGTAVSAAGDVNGDGHGDFLVGAPEHVTAVSSIGQAFGYYGYGSISGLTAVNDSPALANEAVKFEASIAGGGYAIYSWNFGDTGIGVGAKPSHAYTMPGIYTATVTVENPLSVMSATTTVTITVDGLVTPEGGGSVTHTNSQGQGTGVQVPPGAVNSPLSLTFTPLTKGDLTQPEPTNTIDYYFDLGADDPRRIFLPLVMKGAPGSSLVVSQVVEANGANGVEGETPALSVAEVAVAACPTGHFCFLKPVTITITYNEALLPDGTNENTLKLTFWDDELGKWVDAATTCDPISTYNYFPNQDFFTVEVCHFSRFGVVH